MNQGAQLAAAHQREVSAGERFEFGKNWARYLELLDETRIAKAVASLRAMLGTGDLSGCSFLDLGSGSGLFSLAACRLGARVHSVDYDPQSVACTREVKRRYAAAEPRWTIEQGSALDRAYLARQGAFDVVYSWGVLHHTGRMWEALENAAPLVAPGGRLFLSIYNDQGIVSRRWTAAKRAYNRLPRPLRFLVSWPLFLRTWGPTFVRDALKGRPLASWRGYIERRGMSLWRDWVDWIGGYPFEVARPEQIFDFYRQRGFTLERLKTCGGSLGCNEFVFRKSS